jgi:hypothetical protein
MRPSVTWIIVGAVVVIGVFAGLDALRSSGDEPPSAEASATEAVTTTQPETDVVLASSTELETRRVVGLMPGRVTTNERLPLAVTFTVPPGWYGQQRGSGFVLAKSRHGTRLLARSRNVPFAGVTVDTLDRRLPSVLRDIEATPSIGVHDVSRIRIGGHSGRRLSLEPRERGELRELLGLPVFLFAEEQLMVLGVGRKTLLVRSGLGSGGDPERFEVDRILRSFRVMTQKEAIEQTGNGWARLFGAGRTCNRFMGQPACEWVVCMRPGGRRIPNCTPVSSEVQRSFAGAVVEEVVIRGQRAAARFSNGETVRFVAAAAPGRFWWIARVGAGRQFFE